MSIPSRHSAEGSVPAGSRIYFVTSRTAEGKSLLQTARMADLFADVLLTHAAAGKFKVCEFVVMRNHFHALLEIGVGVTVERTVQLIKGNFSYRARKELGFNGEIWQKGFSDVRISDRESFVRHVEYIRRNPVKAGYVAVAEDYPYCSAYVRRIERGAATEKV
jgi:putative transposase